ncbi:MAG TPA: DUF4112 domain-containing protein [Vicinamibacterales bacterium]|nr:DUF4112 domain-containing protein [Vicinamibacterales bacterium]
MRLSFLQTWADLLDSRFRIPGTQIRFGLDPILSLVPGLGDLVSPAYTVVLLVFAIQARVPKVILLRMLSNAMLDALLGAVPVAGNVADIFWRANRLNLELLMAHARPGHPLTRSDYVVLCVIAGIFGLLTIVPVVLAIVMTRLFYLWVTGQ